MIPFVLGWLAGWLAIAAVLWHRRARATLRAVTWLEDGSGLATWGRRRLFVRPHDYARFRRELSLDLEFDFTCRWHDTGHRCPSRVHLAVHAARERDRFNERLLAA